MTGTAIRTPRPAAGGGNRTPASPVWELIAPPSSWNRPARQAVGASGVTLRFADGSTVLDATSGLWNVNLGYGVAPIADAISAALRDASYLTLFRYGHRYATQAAQALLDFAGADRYQQVVFATSGGAVNDLVMKIARQHAALTGAPGRRLVVGLRGSYHGLTFGALSLSGDELGQALYGTNMREIRHVDPADPTDLQVFTDRHGARIAAVVVEPLLGSGAQPLSADFVAALLQARAEHGFLIVCDEVATGFGRTGLRFASDAWPQPPDILLTSKGMTNGTCAAAAALLGPRVWPPFLEHDAPVLHGETQAGSPPSCAAITATIGHFAAVDALSSAARVANRLDEGLRALAADLPAISRLTGAGCFRGVHLRVPAVDQAIVAIRAHGVLVHPGPGCIQLVPPLVCTDDEIDKILVGVRNGLRTLDRVGTPK